MAWHIRKYTNMHWIQLLDQYITFTYLHYLSKFCRNISEQTHSILIEMSHPPKRAIAFVQYVCILGPSTKLDLQCKAWENCPKFNQSGYSWTIFTRAHINISAITMMSSTALFFSLKNSKVQLYWTHSEIITLIADSMDKPVYMTWNYYSRASHIASCNSISKETYNQNILKSFTFKINLTR